MKIKKYSVAALVIVLLLTFTACAADDTGNDNARNNSNTWDRTNTNNALPNDMTGDGFQNQNRTGTGTSGNQNTDLGTNDNLNTGMRRPGRLTTSLGNLNNENSEKIARQIEDLPEVNEASVVVNDNRAIVGIELSNNERQNEISSALRNRIEDMVRDINNEIDEVSITADGEIFERIDTMSNEMLNDDTGDFFERIGSGFDDLIDAITPNLNNNRPNR